MSTIAHTFRRLLGAQDTTRAGAMRACWNGTVLAQSERTVRVEGNHYFPVEDVRSEYLQSSDHQSICPWKGRARYYDIVVAGERNPAAAWYYPKPTRAAARITDHIAFWHGVTVQRVPHA